MATTAANIPSSRDSAFIDGGSTATWNRSHKSGSTAVLDRGSTYELHSMSGDKMSGRFSITRPELWAVKDPAPSYFI